MKHLIFYDDQCGFCQSCVHQILKWDRRELFCFASLSGMTAYELLQGEHEGYRHQNSLVLIENHEGSHPRYYLRAKAVFRILWLIGGFFKLFGILSFLPRVLIDPFYRLIASQRSRFGTLKPEEKSSKRFLK